ncbi:ABC transporter ATP-binding protein [Scrofimicrobium sp. R131]|uniref:ABC transporter ATP-binding protein n=1 Tax=Scrofimicrobium appendicitidis TaxID=3079930 RepID=A0AAU7V7G6_9ACTO
MSLIEVRNLTKFYGPRPAIYDLSLNLEAGQVVGLMGDNGAGKTTLLKILAGLLADWQGSVTIAGKTPGPETKAMVSYLPDVSFLRPNLTPELAIAQYARFFADFDQERAHQMIEYFGLAPTQRLKEMSKGMQEKVQISLTMARNANVYLLDEPISGVDPASREIIMRGIITQFAPQSLMLLSTHLVHDVEPIVDSVVFLRAGQVLLAGNADELRSQYQMGLDALFRKVYQA